MIFFFNKRIINFIFLVLILLKILVMENKVQKFIITNVKTAITGIFLSLFIGLAVREVSRGLQHKISFFDFNVINAFLELGHGHALIFFTIIPLIFAIIIYLIKNNISEDFPEKKMSMYFGLTHLGLLLALILMLYKGLAYVIQYSDNPDLTIIDSALFFGSKTFRILIYAVSHITMSVGLLGSGIIIYKRIR